MALGLVVLVLVAVFAGLDHTARRARDADLARARARARSRSRARHPSTSAAVRVIERTPYYDWSTDGG